MKKEKEFSDKEVFLAIQNQESWAIEYLYKIGYPVARSYILKNGGNGADAKDVFHDALEIFFRNTTDEKFELKAKLVTYLVGIVRLNWLEKRRANRLVLTDEATEHQLERPTDEAAIEAILQEEELYQLVEEGMQNIGEKCRKVIEDRFLEKKSEELIAKELDMTINALKTKRSSCMSRLRTFLKG
ncbi:MAG: sigma-70 family RNA polymerase sigma factor [Bacteroidota bacterium]